MGIRRTLPSEQIVGAASRYDVMDYTVYMNNYTFHTVSYLYNSNYDDIPVHFTPASSEWLQLCTPMSPMLVRHSSRDVSLPLHSRLSNKISPSPSPKRALRKGTASKKIKRIKVAQLVITVDVLNIGHLKINCFALVTQD